MTTVASPTPPTSRANADLIRATDILDSREAAEVRRRAIFDCCKWDPQVGDVATLAPFALMLRRGTWRWLAEQAEALSRELLSAEEELLSHPEMLGDLGLPFRLRGVLRKVSREGAAAGAARLMRFDFHLAEEGWRISEVNSDVPGGLLEASGFTQLMQERFPALHVAGDPVESLAQAIAANSPGGVVALVHATAYTDDRQQMIYFSRRLESLGLRPVLVAPDQVWWDRGRAAHLRTKWHEGAADFLFRFFPAEWLPNLRWRSHWKGFFLQSRTPACNPGAAIVTQSKRWTLLWPRLRAKLPTWRSLLPETRDPRDVAWTGDASWIVKPALGRVGEGILIPGVTPPREALKLQNEVRRHPERWIAQRRFKATAVKVGGHGGIARSVYPCLGVYTVAGRAAGIYGRIGPSPIINDHASDIAVLVENEEVEELDERR